MIPVIELSPEECRILKLYTIGSIKAYKNENKEIDENKIFNIIRRCLKEQGIVELRVVEKEGKIRI